MRRRQVDYEAQAAVELEGVCVDETDKGPGYAMELVGGNWDAKEPVQICAGPLWREMLKDLADAVSKARIAARFHGGLADGFVQAAVLARAATGLGQVVLSGGCMHNRRLARLLRAKLEAEDFEVIHHFRVSPGDGGLSYGQAAVAAAKMSARS